MNAGIIERQISSRLKCAKLAIKLEFHVMHYACVKTSYFRIFGGGKNLFPKCSIPKSQANFFFFQLHDLSVL